MAVKDSEWKKWMRFYHTRDLNSLIKGVLFYMEWVCLGAAILRSHEYYSYYLSNAWHFLLTFTYCKNYMIY